jgi:hypothetical protein
MADLENRRAVIFDSDGKGDNMWAESSQRDSSLMTFGRSGSVSWTKS